QPQQVEPPAMTDAHTGSDAVHLWNRAGPGRDVDDILARRELPAGAADDLGSDARTIRSGEILREGVGVVHPSEATHRQGRSVGTAAGAPAGAVLTGPGAGAGKSSPSRLPERRGLARSSSQPHST